MSAPGKKILIVDEEGFSRVCSAILELQGHKAETPTSFEDLIPRLERGEFSLVIMSFPLGSFLLDTVERLRIPTIIMSAELSTDLMSRVAYLDGSCCMMKPIDYKSLRSLVKQAITGDFPTKGGYSLV